MNARTKLVLAGAGIAAVASLVPQRHADLTIATHRLDDPAPRTVRLAFDAGLLAGSVLVTWTADRIAR